MLGAVFDGERTPRGERPKLRSKLKYWMSDVHSHSALTRRLFPVAREVAFSAFYQVVRASKFFQKKGREENGIYWIRESFNTGSRYGAAA